MQMNTELDRIRAEYVRRATDAHLNSLYTTFQPAHLFAIQSQERAVMALLRAEGIRSLGEQRILDVGCGFGGELRRLLSYGADPRNLYGIDLLPARLTSARHLSPHFSFIQGDGSHLPFPNDVFDMVMQFTVFSSVLDDPFRMRIATEMLRVLKPDGLIIWYDFWLNPTNPATRGIRPAEIKQLFPGCRYRFQRVTLAPPIARRVVPLSWLVGYLLEYLPFLRTHYLVGVRKENGFNE
jgi:ubiquinone/menaquinone biosynthesis C-methylase UbiE